MAQQILKNTSDIKIGHIIVENFFLDGEIVKETTINPIRDRIDMRSKIHPRDFIQKDMLFEFNIGSTSAINEHNKRERK